LLRRKLKIMRKLFVCAFLSVATFCIGQDVFVNGYITGDGNYVQSHYRTPPDNTQYNNYSTVGNVNPYTGKAGYIQPTYGTVSTSINLPLVQQVLATRQASYNTNYKRVSTLIDDMRSVLQSSNLDSQSIASIKTKFNTNYLEPMYAKKYDFSNNSLTTDVINWLNNGLTSIVDEEIKIAKKENVIANLRMSILKEMASIAGKFKTNNVIEETWNFSTKQFEFTSSDNSTSKIFLDAIKGELYYYRQKNNAWKYFTWKYNHADDNFHQLLDEQNNTLIQIDRKAKWVIFYDTKVGDIYTKRYVYLQLSQLNE